MTKYEFLGDLSRLLADLPEEERKQALHYYEDYFADAGEDNEQDVLKELGSPEAIADQIKNEGTEDISYGDSAGFHAADAASFGDFFRGFLLFFRFGQCHNSPALRFNALYIYLTSRELCGKADGWHKMSGSQNSSNNRQKKSGFFAKMDQSNTLIMIIVLIVTSPIWGSVLISIAGILLGIVSAIVGIFAAMIFGGAGSAIGGVATIVGGIIGIIAGKTAGGILTIGVGCLLFALGSAFCYLGIFLVIRLFPLLWKQLQRFWDWITGKLTGKEQSY